MLKKLELSEKDHLFYQNICKKLKIEFISTPYTLEDAKFLLVKIENNQDSISRYS